MINNINISNSIFLHRIRVANVRHLLSLLPWIVLFIGTAILVNSDAKSNGQISIRYIIFLIMIAARVLMDIGSVVKFMTKGTFIIGYEILKKYYEYPIAALNEVDEELALFEKPLKKNIATQNYVINFAEIGVAKNSFMPISAIEEIVFKSREYKEDFRCEAKAFDNQGNDMLIYEFTRSKKQPKTLALEMKQMTEFVRIITNNNKGIKVQNLPKLGDDEEEEVSASHKVSDAGNFHYDEQMQVYVENGFIVDKFGRKIHNT
jgi:hypothetical protein